MGGAPVIVWIRPGVGFVRPAADSFRRFEARLGRQADVNSTFRDWDKQMGMYDAWRAWITGRGPKPPHSRAVHPEYSIHCQGRAWDTDDWRTPGFIALAAEYGWIRTAASDPTEQHHFEYIESRDQHRHEPAPAPAVASTPTLTLEEDIMLIRWNESYVFSIGRESVHYIGSGKDLTALSKLYGPAKDVGNDELTAVLLDNNVHWDAVDATLRSAAYGPDRRYWSRLTAEGIAIRGAQSEQSKALADVLATAERIADDR